MGRGGGGRSSGGGRRSYSAPRGNTRAPPPAPRSNAPAPAAPASSGPSSIVGSVVSTIADGWLWGTGTAMAHRAMDAIMGPRKFEIEHTTAGAAASSSSSSGSSSSSPCEVHALAFQDCINHNGSDISRCQFYVDVLNDCRRRGQAAIVQASG